MSPSVKCPECGKADVLYNDKRQELICKDCGHAFLVQQSSTGLRVFLSYGHDEHASLAERLKADLETRGHGVWFDRDRLRPGGDWENYIEEGLAWVREEKVRGWVVLLMTPHSVRRPKGYCLNEIARALSYSLPVVPVMLVWCEPPLSICRIQWLDMRDCVPVDRREPLYEEQLGRLLEALEGGRLDFEGSQARLLRLLTPLPFDADLDKHLTRFTGRQWVIDDIDAWLASPDSPRAFWLTGSPGVGKTALAAWLCRNRRAIAAFHLCQYGHSEKADPRRAVLSIAYQLSTQLPDYQERLKTLDVEQITSLPDAKTLFDLLLVQPLAGSFPDPGRPVVVLIDALDEATLGGRNALAQLLASEFAKTPSWLRLILTSRPDPEVTHPLQALAPYSLETSLTQNKEDLRLYMRCQFAPFASDGRISDGSLTELLERAEGLFLYVECVREDLAAGRLSLERLEDFPQGLGGVYARYCDRQFGDLAVFRRQVRPALELLVAAREPLRKIDVRAILGWDDYAEQEFFAAVGSFCVVTGERLQLFHRSLADWLTDAAKAGPYFASLQQGHQRLADQGWAEYLDGVDAMAAYTVTHLPSHLLECDRWGDLAKLLSDVEFIEHKSAAEMPHGLIADIDSFISRSPGKMSDESQSERISAHRCLSLALALLANGRYDEAHEQLKEALNDAEALGDDYLVAFVGFQSGRAREYSGHFQEARRRYLDIAQACVSHRDCLEARRWLRLEGRTYHQLGTTAENMGQAEQAKVYLGQAIVIHAEAGNTERELASKRAMAHIFRQAGETTSARAMLIECLESARQYGLGRAEGYCRHQLAGVSLAEGRLEEASEGYGVSLNVGRREGDLPLVAASERGLARATFAEGDVEGARHHYGLAADVSRGLNDRPALVYTLDLWARMERDEGNGRIALRCAEEALRLCEELGDTEKAEAFRALAVAVGQEDKPNGEPLTDKEGEEPFPCSEG